jgi:type 1 glutamine amidotransferase
MTESTRLRVLAVTGGHRVDLAAFGELLDAVATERGWMVTHAEQPDAQKWFGPEHRGAFDALLCHDLPGLALQRGAPPRPVGPDAEVAGRLTALLEAGQGIVFLHHALAGWPGWPGWADVLGGRYHYAPAELRGRNWPDSGFRYAEYTARVIVPDHPVCAGITDFALRDELYCCPVFESEVVALLRADAPPGPFRETYREVLGTTGGNSSWQHPPASELIGWAKSAGRSPIVYLQPGDGPDTFASPMYRRLVGNALAWVASPEAHDWAARQHTEVFPPRSTER